MASAPTNGRDFRSQDGGDRNRNANLIDDFSEPVSNEGNLLTLMTLQNVLKGDGVDPADQLTFKNMAKEETRHLRTAMRVLMAKTQQEAWEAGIGGDMPTPASLNRAQQLQSKFGKDMNGAVKLAKLLKSESDELEVRDLLRPFALAATAKKGAPGSRGAGFWGGNTQASEAFGFNRAQRFN